MKTATIEPWMANEIWDVLVEECGARRQLLPERDDHHWSFVAYLDRDVGAGCHEYRFQGALGFGGKFYNDGFVWQVGCYGEDDTLARLGMIRRANERLATLRHEYMGKVE